MPSRKIFITIFLSSFSALAFEITLTRIFSISLWYHFAFMVISIAMLGIGASGTALAVFSGLRNISHIGIYSFFLGISISLCYLLSNQILFDPVRLSWDRIQLVYISLYYIVLSIPFFFTGLIIGTAFSGMSEKSGLLYGSDLSGAGIGSVAILILMYIFPSEKIIFILSSTAFTGAFIIGGKKIKIASALLTAVNLFVILAGPEMIQPRMSQYKGLQTALRYPGAAHIKTYNSPFSQIDIFRSPAVRFAPGLSLRYLDPLPEQTGISIDGGEINAITFAGDRTSLRFLEHLPAALPYIIGRSRDVLILDPKGGLHALMAEYYGAKNIFKVESDPVLIKAVKNKFGDYSGRIYDANTFSGLGRTWLSARHDRFDIIDIPLMSVSSSGIFGISEDYRFTVEAFREYLNHLKPGGLISITMFILPPPRIELRLLNIIVSAMDEMRIKDAGKHIAVIRSWGTITILAKKTELSSSDIEAIRNFSREKRFDFIYYPGMEEEEANVYVKMPSTEYFSAFKKLLDEGTRNRLINDYIFDIRPSYDLKPFFNYFLRLRNIKPIYEVMGKKWQYFMEEGYLLVAVLIQLLILSILIVIIPIPALLKVKLKVGFLPYFGLLGTGFMFAEISFIQKMILPLGNPSYAVASVLSSILISSASGSLLSHRFPKLRSPYVVFAVSSLIISSGFLLPHLTGFISSQPLPMKAAMAFLALFPAGFFMGIPFPLGLKAIGEKEPALIPWAWAINGCTSVLAPVLTIMLAMEIGFDGVFVTGGLIYLAAFLYVRRFTKVRTP